MISEAVLKKIRFLEIHARRLLSGMQVGDYTTAQKGSGFEFDQIREYQEGDDVRFIDWQSSARMNKLLVRQYLEERNRTINLLVDVSASTMFGSTSSLKSEVIAQLSGMLALVAEYGKDSVGLCMYSDDVETYIPAARGRQHTQTILKTIFEATATKTTSLKKGLEFLIKQKQKKGIVFIISDFLDEDFETALGVVASKFECIAIRCLDELEKEVPAVGLITIKDPETGQEMIIDARKHTTQRLNEHLAQRLKKQNNVFNKYKVDVVDVTTSRDYMADIIRFFRRRMVY